MFTGLIEATARVQTLVPTDSGRRIHLETPLGAELAQGDSVAVNGVCLTVIACDATGFSADVSPATLQVTSLGGFAAGRLVNLERPLRADARLGGHFVLGHVDAVGRLVAIRAQGDHHWLDVDVPPAMAPYVISRGSIAIDGVSLTIAALDDIDPGGRARSARIGIQIIPHTFTHTAFHAARAGDEVNLEVDVIGKYVERLLTFRSEPA